MSKRAEEAAMKAYPIKLVPFYPSIVAPVVNRDVNEKERKIYIEGYEQAEKDHKDYIEKRLENLINKPGEYSRGAREELAHLLSKLGGFPGQYLSFIPNQAEKDLALTPEDISIIHGLLLDGLNYTEVIRRFNEQKKG